MAKLIAEYVGINTWEVMYMPAVQAFSWYRIHSQHERLKKLVTPKNA